MTALLIVFSESIKKEWFYVIVQSLVIQKQLGQETQVLAVDLKRKLTVRLR